MSINNHVDLFSFQELSELHQLSGESIENYRYIQRENQFLINDNKSLATKVCEQLISSQQ
jgi:hypothetical protein